MLLFTRCWATPCQLLPCMRICERHQMPAVTEASKSRNRNFAQENKFRVFTSVRVCLCARKRTNACVCNVIMPRFITNSLFWLSDFILMFFLLLCCCYFFFLHIRAESLCTDNAQQTEEKKINKMVRLLRRRL